MITGVDARKAIKVAKVSVLSNFDGFFYITAPQNINFYDENGVIIQELWRRSEFYKCYVRTNDRVVDGHCANRQRSLSVIFSPVRSVINVAH